MDIEYGFISVLPPVITIILALMTRNVFISLFSGVFLSFMIFSSGNVIAAISGTLNSFIGVFEDPDNTIVIYSVLMLGALIYLIEKSGGIAGFVELMVRKKGIIKSPKAANVFTWIVGILVFTSGTLSTLVTGSVTRPLNDAMKVPHEKSAFLVHTTSTPICVLIPLSGWAASMLGYLQSAGIDASESTSILLKSIPMNFYCLISVAAALVFSLIGFDFGPMKRAEIRARETGLLDDPASNPMAAPVADDLEVLNQGVAKARNLILPILVLIITIVTVMLVTGNGNILDGSGMQAILWGPFVALLVAAGLYISQKTYTVNTFLDDMFSGASHMLSIAFILIFAYAMGGVVKQLGTGQYLADVFANFLSPGLLPALVFLMACVISFSTGTSLGTMAITMVIAIPMAATLGVDIPLVASAVWGGSIFGDHASPISDTTVMACTTTGCNVIDHVKSQIPYCLCFAVVTVALYVLAGFIL